MNAMEEAIANLHGQTAALVPIVKMLIDTHPDKEMLLTGLTRSIAFIEQMHAKAQADVMMSDEQAQPVTPLLMKQNEASLAILRILASK
jgi:hypothetical protein